MRKFTFIAAILMIVSSLFGQSNSALAKSETSPAAVCSCNNGNAVTNVAPQQTKQGKKRVVSSTRRSNRASKAARSSNVSAAQRRAYNKRLAAVAAREKAVGIREQEVGTKSDAVGKREETVQKREDAVKKREDAVKLREDAIAKQEKELKDREDAVAAREKAAKESEGSLMWIVFLAGGLVSGILLGYFLSGNKKTNDDEPEEEVERSFNPDLESEEAPESIEIPKPVRKPVVKEEITIPTILPTKTKTANARQNPNPKTEGDLSDEAATNAKEVEVLPAVEQADSKKSKFPNFEMPKEDK